MCFVPFFIIRLFPDGNVSIAVYISPMSKTIPRAMCAKVNP